MKTMKYTDAMICFQEIPDEVSLSLSISNCPHHCPGCHSSYLAQDIGVPVLDCLGDLLNENGKFITCVLFMGGDDAEQQEDLKQALLRVKCYGLKTALYSGADIVDKQIVDLLDYVKVGPYVEELGGLNRVTTNQKMYKKVDGGWQEITSLFWAKGLRYS